MFTALFSVYALIHFSLLVWLVSRMRRERVPGGLIIAFVAAGLTYDNATIALGSQIGMGSLLEALSWPRFALHAAFTPFVMVAAWQMARSAGVSWTIKPLAQAGLWAIVLAMVAYGVFIDLVGLEIQPACLADTLRYSSSTPPPQFCSPEQVRLPGHGPPVPSIITVIICLIAGAGIWWRRRWPWLAIAAVIMFVAAGVPASRFGPSAGNGGEVILQLGLVLTAWRFRPRGS